MSGDLNDEEMQDLQAQLSPRTPDELVSTDASGGPESWLPRFRNPPSFDPIEQFLYEQSGNPNAVPKAELPAKASGVEIRVPATKYGPILSSVGLMKDSAMASRPAAGSQSADLKIPPHVLKAHVQANYQQTLTQALHPKTVDKLRALPPKVVDTVLTMALVSPSCWKNLDTVIDEVYEGWWPIWRASTQLALAPQSNNAPLRLVLYLGQGGWGLPWVAAEGMLLLVKRHNPKVQIRVEGIVVYDDIPPSQTIIGHLARNPGGAFAGVAIHYRKSLQEFPQDVETQDRAMLAGCRWFALMQIPILKKLEPLENEQTSTHRAEYQFLWAWYSGIQKLEQIAGRAQGVAVTGTAANFKAAELDFLSGYFGKLTSTDAAQLQRAERQAAWMVSPHGLPSKLELDAAMHPGSMAPSAPLSDGYCWMPSSLDVGEACHPPFITPIYPSKLFQMTTGADSSVGTKVYCQCLKVTHPVSNHVKYGGVEFVLRQLGAEGTGITHMSKLYPCLVSFDRRDGKTMRCPPMYATKCGEFMLCHNCRCIVEGLATGWDIPSAVEICFRALTLAWSEWTQGDSPLKFNAWTRPAHVCDDQCRVDVQPPEWTAMQEQ